MTLIEIDFAPPREPTRTQDLLDPLRRARPGWCLLEELRAYRLFEMRWPSDAHLGYRLASDRAGRVWTGEGRILAGKPRFPILGVRTRNRLMFR